MCKWRIGYAKFWGGGGANKVHYGKCGNGKYLATRLGRIKKKAQQ